MENNTVFVLLAGGKSKRMGAPKGLLKYNDDYWILEQLNRIAASSITKVYIGLGYDCTSYFNKIPWLQNAEHDWYSYKSLQIKIVVNNKPELGPFSTLQTVLQKVNNNNTVFINHIDIPLLNSKELELLISEKNEIVIPKFNGKKGHPIKIENSFWNHLLNVDLSKEDARLDFQLKKVNPAKISIVEVLDRVILYNLNTPLNWEAYLNELL